jgi:hypothetical protein
MAAQNSSAPLTPDPTRQNGRDHVSMPPAPASPTEDAGLPRRFPDPINDDEKLLESSFVVSTECLGDVARAVRASGPA